MIPTSVNILGSVWLVRKVNDLPDMGSANPVNRTISLDDSLAPSVMVETFYHELVHAILMHTGHQEHFDEKQNEALAQGLGMTLAFVVAANELPRLPFNSEEETENDNT